MAKIIETDVLTGNRIERDFTAEELAQKEIDQANYDAAQKAKTEAQNKRLAALAKLEALGLDEADLKALGL